MPESPNHALTRAEWTIVAALLAVAAAAVILQHAHRDVLRVRTLVRARQRAYVARLVAAEEALEDASAELAAGQAAQERVAQLEARVVEQDELLERAWRAQASPPIEPPL